MKRFLLPLRVLPLIILLTLLSCEEEDDGPPTQPSPPTQVESIILPEKMALESDTLTTDYPYIIQVAVSGGYVSGTVSCTIYDSIENDLGGFTLRDDAGYPVIEGEPEFVSQKSGDVVAGDGIFTRRINSLFTDTEGDFTAEFHVFTEDSTVSSVSEYNINVYENQPPILSEPDSLPDALESGFSPFSLNITVIDPQGWEDIAQVKFELILDNIPKGTYLMADPDMDSVFTYYMEPSFAAGMGTGDYIFRFSAEDFLGDITCSPDYPVFIENLPPVLSLWKVNPDSIQDSTYVGPDTVLILPDTGEIAELKVTIDVQDPQGQDDIEYVYINYERPPHHQPPDSIWTYGYPMADNGLAWDLEKYLENLPFLGDEEAGDGIYTFTKLYTFEADTGIHKFHFHCFDGAGQAADSVTAELYILLSED